MVTHLVLGCSTLGHALVSELSERSADLHVLDPDPTRVDSLRNERVAAEQADVTDPVAVGAVTPVDVIIVASSDPDRNYAAATAAREAQLDAYLIAYVGTDATGRHRRAMDDLADRVIDPGAAVLDYVADRQAEGHHRKVRELRGVLREIEGTLGVFAHDNPDPDAIASAVALARLAATVGLDAEVCYFGNIAHQENRALVNLLDYDLRRLDPEEIPAFGGIALVDHSRPGVNDQLPADTPVDVVIDHHPTEAEIESRFVDIRDTAGATSTLLTDYLRGFDVDPDEAIATGLLYGIRIDTKDFTREITQADFEAAAYLLPHVDADVLKRVESPSVDVDTMATIARAIRNRQLDGSALATCVGTIGNRDALAQAADRLLDMEGVTTTLVCGIDDGAIYVSARSRQPDIDLGAILREAFDEVGSAGGHDDMAGAQIPLGLFDAVEGDEADLATIVGDGVTERFFTTLREQYRR